MGKRGVSLFDTSLKFSFHDSSNLCILMLRNVLHCIWGKSLTLGRLRRIWVSIFSSGLQKALEENNEVWDNPNFINIQFLASSTAENMDFYSHKWVLCLFNETRCAPYLNYPENNFWYLIFRVNEKQIPRNSLHLNIIFYIFFLFIHQILRITTFYNLLKN